MKYRKFTKDELQVSQLGFGCMRFPVLDGDNSRIDVKPAMKMIRHAIDNGVNYIDTAYVYHGDTSESFLKGALADGYRDRVYLATKSPVWMAETYEHFWEKLDEQLERLGTDHIDFYLLHALSKKRWDQILTIDVLRFLDEAKKSGKIRYAGFSFHDEREVFQEIIDSYDWDFCQIQLNYMDTDYQAGIKGLEYAHAKGISVVIMEPVKGGKLAYPPKKVQEIFHKQNASLTPAAWALSYIWNRPEVSVVLSGMSTLAQVEENLRTADHAAPGTLSEADLQAVADATAYLKERVQVGCTSCEYCMPCPYGVNIPGVFEHFNNAFVYDLVEENRSEYRKRIEKEQDASHCVECGRCESLCPQFLPIIDDLKRAHAFLTQE